MDLSPKGVEENERKLKLDIVYHLLPGPVSTNTNHWTEMSRGIVWCFLLILCTDELNVHTLVISHEARSYIFSILRVRREIYIFSSFYYGINDCFNETDLQVFLQC